MGFWCYKRNTHRCIIVPIENRSTETLTAMIQKHIVPGIIIYTDAWKGYTNLSALNYKHSILNHSNNFVNPVTGVHTQNIERLLREIRSSVPRYGILEKHYKHYLPNFYLKGAHTYTHTHTTKAKRAWSRYKYCGSDEP